MRKFLLNYIQAAPMQMISYAEYINLALYHPEFGYYMKEINKIGRNGDFITTSNISDLYAKLLARWFNKLIHLTGIEARLCEIGPGTGKFAKAFLEEWSILTEKPLYYYLLEKSPYHQKLQNEQLSIFKNVKYISNLSEIAPFSGMIFSNELFDAFPVHVIEKQKDKLFEVMVALKEEQLVEKLVPLTNKEIIHFLKEQSLALKDGQRIEIPLLMCEYIKGIGNCLDNGVVVTVDYGYTNDEWTNPSRRNGSLRGYYQHNMIDDVLLHPGSMDITTHIHFDALINEGEKYQLEYFNLLRQDEFLLSVGILEELQQTFDPNPFSEQSKKNRAVRSLIMADGISQYFHVAIQKKKLNVQMEDVLQNPFNPNSLF